jgi:hydroxymethylpyrimidine/phosphomethylpyrimidine kinase
MDAPPVILSIAGYDPSSGAGITADIKTAVALGCYAVTCMTALTVQSTQGVFRVEPVRPEIVVNTLNTLADDLPIAAVRLGMMGSVEVAEAVAGFLEARRLPNLVLDPVLRSTSGTPLVDPAGLEVIRKRLMPLSHVITPNFDEAATLAEAAPMSLESGWEEILPHLRILTSTLHGLGARGVVITGGHLDPPNDFLSYRQAGERKEAVFPSWRIESNSTHGTGCAFAAAIACALATGHDLPTAVKNAKAFVRSAIESAYPLGKGIGPINHQAAGVSSDKSGERAK